MNASLPADLMETVAELFPDAIVGVNGAGFVEVWTAAAEDLFGWKAHDIVGLPLPSELHAIAALMEPGVNQDELHEVISSDRAGKLLRLEVRARTRQPGGWLFIIADRTDERDTAEELRSVSGAGTKVALVNLGTVVGDVKKLIFVEALTTPTLISQVGQQLGYLPVLAMASL